MTSVFFYNVFDPEEMWITLKEHIFLNGMNLFIPKVKRRVHQFPMWFTSQLRHLNLLNVYRRFNVSIRSILLLKTFKNLLELSALSRMQVRLPSVSMSIVLYIHVTSQQIMTLRYIVISNNLLDLILYHLSYTLTLK